MSMLLLSHGCANDANHHDPFSFGQLCRWYQKSAEPRVPEMEPGVEKQE